MRRLLTIALFVLLAHASSVARAAAQNLVITNARIIVGNGQVIERGSLVAQNGRITSVAAGTATRAGWCADDRRARHDSHGRIHRCAPPHHPGATPISGSRHAPLQPCRSSSMPGTPR
jgi:hypothetical protein